MPGKEGAKTRPGPKEKITPELLILIFERLAHGESERSIFRSPGFPSWSCWNEYKGRHSAEIDARYTRAKESCYKAWEEEIVKISEDDSRDLQPDGKGGYKSDNTAVNRDRLKVDTRKWLMSKIMPKVYGEKIEQQVTGKDGAELKISVCVKSLTDPKLQIDSK